MADLLRDLEQLPRSPRRLGAGKVVLPRRAQKVEENGAADQSQERGNPHHPKAWTSFTVPNVTALEHSFALHIWRNMVDSPTMETLQNRSALNWMSHAGVRATPLLPMLTIGDGNCLMHAARLAMLCENDTDLRLRSAVHDTINGRPLHANAVRYFHPSESTPGVMDAGEAREMAAAIHRRWLWQENNKNMEGAGFSMSDDQWEDEWCQATKNSSTTPQFAVKETGSPGFDSLNEVHVFTMAQVLRRPVVVVADKMLYGTDGAQFAPNYYSGLYLPLLVAPEKCSKVPIVLTYLNSHFCGVVPMDTGRLTPEGPWPVPVWLCNQDPAFCGGANDVWDVVPLERSAGEMLDIQFSFDPGPTFSPSQAYASHRWTKDTWNKFRLSEQKPVKQNLLCAYLDVVTITTPVMPLPDAQDESNGDVDAESPRPSRRYFPQTDESGRRVIVAADLAARELPSDYHTKMRSFIASHTHFYGSGVTAQHQARPPGDRRAFNTVLDEIRRYSSPIVAEVCKTAVVQPASQQSAMPTPAIAAPPAPAAAAPTAAAPTAAAPTAAAPAAPAPAAPTAAPTAAAGAAAVSGGAKHQPTGVKLPPTLLAAVTSTSLSSSVTVKKVLPEVGGRTVPTRLAPRKPEPPKPEPPKATLLPNVDGKNAMLRFANHDLSNHSGSMPSLGSRPIPISKPIEHRIAKRERQSSGSSSDATPVPVLPVKLAKRPCQVTVHGGDGGGCAGRRRSPDIVAQDMPPPPLPGSTLPPPLPPTPPRFSPPPPLVNGSPAAPLGLVVGLPPQAVGQPHKQRVALPPKAHAGSSSQELRVSLPPKSARPKIAAAANHHVGEPVKSRPSTTAATAATEAAAAAAEDRHLSWEQFEQANSSRLPPAKLITTPSGTPDRLATGWHGRNDPEMDCRSSDEISSDEEDDMDTPADVTRFRQSSDGRMHPGAPNIRAARRTPDNTRPQPNAFTRQTRSMTRSSSNEPTEQPPLPWVASSLASPPEQASRDRFSAEYVNITGHRKADRNGRTSHSVAMPGSAHTAPRSRGYRPRAGTVPLTAATAMKPAAPPASSAATDSAQSSVSSRMGFLEISSESRHQRASPLHLGRLPITDQRPEQILRNRVRHGIGSDENRAPTAPGPAGDWGNSTTTTSPGGRVTITTSPWVTVATSTPSTVTGGRVATTALSPATEGRAATATPSTVTGGRVATATSAMAPTRHIPSALGSSVVIYQNTLTPAQQPRRINNSPRPAPMVSARAVARAAASPVTHSANLRRRGSNSSQRCSACGNLRSVSTMTCSECFQHWQRSVA